MPLPVTADEVRVHGDTREQRARRIAWAYRRQLESSDLSACRALDQVMYEVGEFWVADKRPLDPDELLAAPDMASLLAIQPHDLRNWASRGYINRYCADDGSPKYHTGEVVAHMAAAHAARRTRR